jgi:exodeoxyribonuclease-5
MTLEMTLKANRASSQNTVKISVMTLMTLMTLFYKNFLVTHFQEMDKTTILAQKTTIPSISDSYANQPRRSPNKYKANRNPDGMASVILSITQTFYEREIDQMLVKLTREQQDAEEIILESIKHKQVVSLGGLAGTGKSTVGSSLRSRREMRNFAPVALTGRAVSVMKSKGMTDAATIHSTIYVYDPRTRRFSLKKSVPYRGFIADESSMVGQRVYNDMLSFDLPCIFIGDHGQLPPVMDDKIDLMEKPTVVLGTIHRNAGDIRHFAHGLRHGRCACAFLGNDRSVIRMLGKELRRHEDYDHILAMYAREDRQIICGTNRTRLDISARVRAVHGYKNEIEVGDRLMCVQNRPLLGLYNGLQGVVTGVNLGNHTLTLHTDDGLTLPGIEYDPEALFVKRWEPTGFYNPDAPVPFYYAYCVTCHKAQGGEWDRVLVLEEWCPNNARAAWNYTAASRAKNRLRWAGIEYGCCARRLRTA